MAIRSIMLFPLVLLGLASLAPLSGQGGRGQVRRLPEWVTVEPAESGPEYIDYSVSKGSTSSIEAPSRRRP